MRRPTRYPRRNREQWEQVRQQAAVLYAQGRRIGQVATVLDVSPETAQVWCHKWKQGDAQVLRPKSPGGPRPQLSPASERTHEAKQAKQQPLDAPR